MKGFVVLPHHRSGRAHLLRIGRNRRLAKDFENLAETLATVVTLASMQLALRRPASVTSVKMAEKRVAEEVAKGQAGTGRSVAGSALISGGVSSAMPSI